MKKLLIAVSIIFPVTSFFLSGMELEVQDSKFESLFKNHVKYEQYENALFKISKTARRNYNFEYIQKLVCAMHNNQEIDGIIRDYKNNKVANSIRNSRMMSDVESAQALFDCEGDVHDSTYIHKVVENGSITLLKWLKKNQKMKFNNPELIKIALNTKEFDRINFVLDQQEKNSQDSKFYSDILKLIPKSYKLDIPEKLSLYEDKERAIALEMYKHLLDVRKGNIQQLEHFVCGFYDDMKQLQRIQILFELNFGRVTFDKRGHMRRSNGEILDFKEIFKIINKYPKGINTSFELNSDTVNNIKEITFSTLKVMNKYQKFSEELIKKKWEPLSNYTYELAKQVLIEYKDHKFWLGRSNFWMGLLSGCIFAAKNSDSNQDGTLTSGVLLLAWYIKKLYAHFKERNEKYFYAKNILATHKNIYYLEGYMQGLLSENDQIENQQENLQEQYYEKNLYESNLLIKILLMMPLFQTFLFPLIIFDPSLMKFVALTIVSLPMLIGSFLQSGKVGIGRPDDLDRLLACVYKRGKRDGWVQRNSDQLQLNQQQQQAEDEQIPTAKPSLLKTFFGIIKYPINLLGKFASKYKIRNPERT